MGLKTYKLELIGLDQLSVRGKLIKKNSKIIKCIQRGRNEWRAADAAITFYWSALAK